MDNELSEELYLKYSSELYLYLFSLCRNHSQTEDLVSETFLKAIVSFDDYDVKFKFWLFRVGKNLWIDSLKKKREFPTDDYQNISSGSSALDELIHEEEQKDLYEAILRLPQKYREILIYYYYQRFSLKEIANLIGIKPGNARTILSRARCKLKDEIKDVE